MAISYHVEVREIGQSAITRYDGITGTNHVMTGLTEATDYEARVREVDTTNGILTWSAWTAWTPQFSTLAASGVDINIGVATENSTAGTVTLSDDVIPPVITLIGGADIVIPEAQAWSDPGATVTDNVDPTTTIYSPDSVDVNTVGTYILNYDYTDAAGNPATQVQRTVRVATVAPAVEYNVEYREDGGATTQVTGVTDLFLVINSLASNQLHEFRVQGVGNTGATSEWAEWTQFTTAAGVGVDININAANETSTAGVVTLSSAGATVVNINTASETNTADTVTLQITVGEIPAEAYDIEIENLINNQVTYIDNAATVENYTATLVPGTRYRFRVRGRTIGGSVRGDYSAWSDTFVAHFTPQASVSYGPSNLQLTSFYVDLDPIITYNNVPDILGTVNNSDAIVNVTFEGVTTMARNRSGNWNARLVNYADRLAIKQQDELEYPFAVLLSGDMQTTGEDGLLL